VGFDENVPLICFSHFAFGRAEPGATQMKILRSSLTTMTSEGLPGGPTRIVRNLTGALEFLDVTRH
jgi:hypothetical protein